MTPAEPPYAITRAGPDAAAAFASLHATSFQPAWDTRAFATFLSDAQCLCFIAGPPGDDAPSGMIVTRMAGGEAEILTLAVSPQARGRGLGRSLVEAVLPVLAEHGIESVFGEVRIDNGSACALYRRLGFREVGGRRDYYSSSAGNDRRDALILRLDL